MHAQYNNAPPTVNLRESLDCYVTHLKLINLGKIATTPVIHSPLSGKMRSVIRFSTLGSRIEVPPTINFQEIFQLPFSY